MNHRRTLSSFAIITSAFAALAFACAVPSCRPPSTGEPGASPAAADSLRVAVSIPPQADFVRRIGGDRVQVDVFVSPGQDPHNFSATPKQVMALAGSRAYFTIGMPFEKNLSARIKSAVPDLRIIDTAKGIDYHARGEHEGGHGNEDHKGHGGHKGHEEKSHAEGEHEKDETAARPEAGHDGHDHSFDPHVWLAPPMIHEVARNIHDALVEIDPSNAAQYAANLSAFQSELDQLHADLTLLLDPFRGSSFYVYHPAFTHFAETYGLHQKSIEAGGKSPTPKQLLRLIEEAKEDGAKIVFFQPQFDPSSPRTVAEAIGARVVSIDPLADNVLPNLRKIAEAIYGALAEP